MVLAFSSPSDIQLIYAQGGLFYVEIKNYKGGISYPVRHRIEQAWQRGTLVQQQVVDGFDDSRLLREKVGNYWERRLHQGTPQLVEENHFCPASCPAVERHP